MAGPTGIDEAATWEQGFVERVSSGMYILSLGTGDLARRFLATTELLA